jgi:hypothetical protein
MKRLRSLRLNMAAGALVIGLVVGGPVAVWGQTSCIDECLAQLVDCRNGTLGGSLFEQAHFLVNCEEQFEQCLDACLGGQQTAA